jgi:ferredoxin
MPGNYTPLYGAQALEKQEKMFIKAKTKIEEVIQAIRKKETAPIAWGPWFVSGLVRLTRFYNMFLSHVKESDKAFIVQDTCDGCGICAKVCPVDNIQLQNNQPVWQHHCENCLACLQWCPKEAIQYGKVTIGRKRYHHPEITLKDILAQKA